MISKEEKHLIILITVLAALLRLWDYSVARIEHFDEGVYASNIWFDQDEGYRYPDRHLYAPPLLPMFIEWSHVVFEATPLAALLPGLLSGIATVPLLWWFGRQVGGPLAGLAAAALLATNEVHILYTRTALTEPLLCFWMLLSILLACQSIPLFIQSKAGHLKALLSAGLSGTAAALAWLTKYNGWLSLAIILSAALAWGLFSKLTIRKWGRLTGVVAVILFVSILLWLPYLYSLQKFGGYAAVAGNHQQYFVGFSGWKQSLFAQITKQLQLFSITTVCGFGIAGVLFWKRTQETETRFEFSSFSFKRIPLGGWMTASWLIGLGVAIPLYYPYPRLCVPWMLAFNLSLGLTLAFCPGIGRPVRKKDNDIKKNHFLVLFSVIILSGVSLIGPLRSAPAWQSRKELYRIAENCVADAGEVALRQGFAEEKVIFYVYGEPAIFYHLSASNRLAGPIGHLDFAKPGTSRAPYPTFLVIGPHAERSELFHKQWKELGRHFRLISQYQYVPSLLVQLNEKETGRAKNISWPVKLYQLK